VELLDSVAAMICFRKGEFHEETIYAELGYCAADAMKFAGEHSKVCGLMDECVKSGYGIFSDGKWYPFDAKGNELAKALFEKTSKKDHIKVTIEGMKHEGKIMVDKLTEEGAQ
jgi:hypothetical protein